MRRLLLSLVLLGAPALAAAHGDSPSLEKEVGPYLIDIGVDQIGYRPNEEITFDFDIFRTGESPSFESFDVVQVNIKQGEEVFMQQELINQKDFVPTMKVVFPVEGDYTLNAIFFRQGAPLANASFALEVRNDSGTAGRTLQSLTYITAAALVIFALGIAVRSYVKARRAA